MTYSKITSSGTMTWSCYIENCSIVKHVIMSLNCTYICCISTVQPYYSVPYYSAVFNITGPCYGSKNWLFYYMSIVIKLTITWFHF